jgi:hypothetical protein
MTDNNITPQVYKHYKLYQAYRIGTFNIEGWSDYIVILNDDKNNPVLVYGISKGRPKIAI